MLDRVANPHPDTNYVARFTAPEFTTLCPITGQPDFAHLVIDYVPGKWLVESKSLKLYLSSFRNHGAFHEDCTVTIGKRLTALLKPKWLRIGGYWYPRGGMPIDVFWQAGQAAGRRLGARSGRRALSRARLSSPLPTLTWRGLAPRALAQKRIAVAVPAYSLGASAALLKRVIRAVLAAATKGKAPRRAISG